MDEIDQIFRTLAMGSGGTSPIIVCFYTASGLLQFSDSMPRSPEPACGMFFGSDFSARWSEALRCNPAIHDGAVLVRRTTPDERYRIVGWSQRLFPPHWEGVASPNRGSAFNSCLAMSAVDAVDAVYLVARREVHRFAGGVAFDIAV